MSQLDHPNLPRLYEYFQQPEHWFLVMDFITGETLDEYQSKAPRQRLLLSDALDIGIQLCTVLYYLHSQQPLTTRDPSEAPFRFTPLRPKGPQSHSEPGSLTTSMSEILVNKLETLIASMLAMDASKRPSDIASVKEELRVISKLWSEIHRSYWRPKLGFSSQPRQ